MGLSMVASHLSPTSLAVPSRPHGVGPWLGHRYCFPLLMKWPERHRYCLCCCSPMLFHQVSMGLSPGKQARLPVSHAAACCWAALVLLGSADNIWDLLPLLASNHLLICCIATVVTADLLHNEGNTSCPLAPAAVVAGGIPYGSPLGSCRRGGWD